MGSAEFYFNSDNGSLGLWNITPDNLKDGNSTTTAGTITDNDEHNLDGNTYAANVDYTTITNVYLRVHGAVNVAAPFTAALLIKPILGGSTGGSYDITSDLDSGYAWTTWRDITNDAVAPTTWSWTDIGNLDCVLHADVGGGFDTFEASVVQIKVEYAGLVIKYGDTAAYLNIPTSLMESTTKTIQNLVFNSGNDVQLDRGKTGDALTLSGTETSSATANMESLNTFMDLKRIVTVSGLPDDNLNTDYRISNLDFVQEAGFVDVYNYNITLERIYDRMG